MSQIGQLTSKPGFKDAKFERKSTDAASIWYSIPAAAADVPAFMLPKQVTFEVAPRQLP